MFVDFNILNQLGSPSINSNTFANRPSAGQVGRLFVSTDTFEIYRDNGTGWDLIGGPGSSTVTGSGAAGQVTYWTGTNSVGGENNLWWDAANNHLGINTSTPGVALDVHSAADVGVQLNGTGATPSILQAFLSAGVSQYEIGYNWNSDINYRRFSIYDVQGAKEVISIDQQSRYVGINYQYTSLADQPSYTFDVFGTGRFTEDILVNGLTIGKGNASVLSNTAIGASALLLNTTGIQNTALGFTNLSKNTTGNQNTAIGDNVLKENIAGSGNTGLGHAALYILNGGNNNVAIGYDTMYNSITGDDNIAIGRSSFFYLNASNQNIAIGKSSGLNINSGSNLTTATDSIFFGYDTRASANGNTNEIVIGTSARGNGSNTVTIGNSSITTNNFTGIINAGSFIPSSSTIPTNGLYLPAANSLGLSTNSINRIYINSSGNVGIGLNVPNAQLAVNTTTTGTEAENIRLEMNTAAIPASSGLNFRFGSVNAATIYGVGENGGSGASSMRFYSHNGTASAERMRISTAANLLINTTTDNGYKLQVNGNASFAGNIVNTAGALVYTNAVVNQTNRAIAIRKFVGFDGSDTNPTILQIDVPAKEYFIVIEALIIKTRAGGTLQDVGTSEVNKWWFAIARNGSGYDVVLNNDLGSNGWAVTTTTAGGADNMNAISPTITRSGAEPNTATQGVKIEVDITGSTSNYNSCTAIFNINIMGEVTDVQFT